MALLVSPAWQHHLNPPAGDPHVTDRMASIVTEDGDNATVATVSYSVPGQQNHIKDVPLAKTTVRLVGGVVARMYKIRKSSEA